MLRICTRGNKGFWIWIWIRINLRTTSREMLEISNFDTSLKITNLKLKLHCPGANSMVSCQKGPTRHAYAWQIGPFWQDTLELCSYGD